MKRILALFAALLSLWLFAGPLWADQHRVRVGIYQNGPKVDYTSQGRPEGLFVDLIEAIARQEGWTIDYVPGTWSEGLARLESGQIDLMPDVARTSGRELQFTFHREPVLTGWSQIYTRRGSGIRTLLDLKGTRVAVLAGSIQQDFVAQMVQDFGIALTLVPLPDYEQAFAAVAAGRADAVVTNPFYGSRHAPQAGLEDTAIIFNPRGFYFAAPRAGNAVVLAAIDRHLLAWKGDPTSLYYQSMQRWTGEVPRSVVPGWLKWGALAAALLLSASLLWAVTLRRTAARLRASEQRQRELTAELSQALTRLRARTDDLQVAHDGLQTFSYSVSHDLRAPLASIAGFSSNVLRLNQDRLDAQSVGMLHRVLGATRRMETLIDDLLALAHASQDEMVMGPVDLSGLADEVIGNLRQASPERQVDVRVAPGMRVHGDHNLLRIVLENLIGNAWKFTSTTPDARIEVSLAEQEGTPACCVRDNGAGFDMQYAQKLFSAFQRLHTEAQFPGSGIGLSIVQRVISRHGGQVWAQGQPGAGAAFFFTLPPAPGGPASA